MHRILVSCLFPMCFLYSASKSPDQGHSNRRHTESLKPLSRYSPLPPPSPPSLGLVYALEAGLEVSLLLKIGKQNWGRWLPALLDGLQAQPRASSVAILFFIRTIEAEDSTKILNSVCLILIFVLANCITLPLSPLCCCCCWGLLLF